MKQKKILPNVLVLTLICIASQAFAQSKEETQSLSGETYQYMEEEGKQVRKGQQGDVSVSDDQVLNVQKPENKIGSFLINPALSISEYYDDNIFYTREMPETDNIIVFDPSISLKSDWDKHELNIHSGATIGRYRDNDSENYEDYFLSLDGHIDLSKKGRIFGGAQYNFLHEGRESPDDVLGTEPTEYKMLDIYAGGQHEFDRLGVKLGATMQDYDFEDVSSLTGVINNDDRDRQEYEIGARVIYPWKSNIRTFMQVLIGARDYDDNIDDAGFDRDSDVFAAALGLAAFKRNLNIEFLAGGLWQHYDDQNLPSINTPDFGARVSWKPSPKTNIDANIDRRIRETTLSGASGYVSTTGSISFHHDLTKALSLNVGASYTDNSYEGIDRKDDLLGFDYANRYYLTPQIYTGWGYQFLHRDSNLAGEDFFDNRVVLRAGAHLNKIKPSFESGSGFGDEGGSFFVGIHEGHGTSLTALDGPRGAGGTVTADFGDHGSITGLFAGYDRFFGNWFMGAEADAEVSQDIDFDHLETNGRIFDVSREESFGLSLRGGYRQPNNVAYYGRAGVVYTGFETNYERGANFVSRDETDFGFRFGGGLEAPVTKSSGFVRMDYGYATYEDYAMTLPSGTDFFDNSEILVRLGLIYRTGIKKAEQQNNLHDFSGPYVGAQIGYGGFASRNNGPRNAGAELNVDRASHGGTSGLYAGYGLLFSNIYLGLEAEGEASYADWNIDRDPTGRVYDARKDWTFGGSLRTGYVFNNAVLLYGRVGGVIGGFETNYIRGAQNIDQQDSLSGLRYGGGMEVATSEKISIRMDYSYTSYEDYKVNYVTGIDTFKPTETMMRLGLSYSF